jgi:uncharacterized protein (TIGR03435 family)
MRTALVFAALAIPCAVRAQGQDDRLPSNFEVASVKRNSSTPSGRMTFQASAGGRLTAGNMPLRLLIQHAYDVRPFQISDGPSWIDTERYDIVAKADSAVPEKNVVGPMLRALLEDRFGLKLHRETRELPVLNLMQKTSGKLTISKTVDCADAGPAASLADSSTLPCHEVVLSISPTGARLRGDQASTGQLAVTLANILGRPVIDRTAFGGKFDLDVEVSLDGLDGILEGLGIGSPAAPASGNMIPSILTALPEQLGLKLTAGKGPVEVLVIEHVQRPSEN